MAANETAMSASTSATSLLGASTDPNGWAPKDRVLRTPREAVRPAVRGHRVQGTPLYR